ncbi:multidrug effflux MFS transporter [Sinomonas humi]|uniref:multidrug effflux MFS transporter n=1 Tax=Sinomonas humi TaxID=1338436 RepID=UPI0006902502|nr:multidrug effflux MFS transporter [Sinomonas humi]
MAVAALAFLVVLGPLTTDLYLPAFPRMSEDLGATAGEIQASVSAALLGVAAGQLVVGAVSDSFGRRKPMLAATGLHVAASIALASVGSVDWMLALRVLQGFGAAGAAVVASAIARDAFNGPRLVGVLARLALLSGLAPVLAPFVGSLLLRMADWRGIFEALAVYGAVMMCVCAVAVPETLRPPRQESRAPVRSMLGRYQSVLRDRSFNGALLVGAMVCAGVFAYLSASPFVFEHTYGLDAGAYGIVFAVNASAFALGSQISALVLRRRPLFPVLGWALPLGVGGGLGGVVADVFGWGLPCFTVGMFIFLFSAGASMPVVQVIALQRHRLRAGTAAALLGSGNFSLASLISPLSSLDGGSPLAVGLVLIATSATATLALGLILRGRATPVLAREPVPREETRSAL